VPDRKTDRHDEMRLMLRSLKLPAIAGLYQDLALKAAKANLTHRRFCSSWYVALPMLAQRDSGFHAEQRPVVVSLPNLHRAVLPTDDRTIPPPTHLANPRTGTVDVCERSTPSRLMTASCGPGTGRRGRGIKASIGHQCGSCCHRRA
jgi:hypothetical protein